MGDPQRKEFILTDYAKNLIRFKAWQLSQQHGFDRADREEVEQDLWLAVVGQADRFDPTRSSLDTFVARVVEGSAAAIVRGRRRPSRRRGRSAESLDAVLHDASGGETSLAAAVTEADRDRRLGCSRRDEVADREDQDAVAAALAAMPPDVGEVCRRVAEHGVTRTANELGTSRRQVRNVLSLAKPFLERSGFST